MNEQLTLFIHDFKGRIHQVTVNPADTIDSISKSIGIDSKLLHFFNGMLLIGAFTFAFYKLTNGDHIYSIPIGPYLSQDVINKFHSLKTLAEQDSQLHKQRIESFVRETARLKDQFFEKLEGTVNCNRKLIQRFRQLIQEEATRPQENTVIPPQSSTPSSGELPQIWN